LLTLLLLLSASLLLLALALDQATQDVIEAIRVVITT